MFLKLKYMFRTVPLPIIRSLFTVHSALVYVIQVSWELSSTTSSILVLLESCLQTCMTYTSAEGKWINSWCWAEELPETCRVSCQNKFMKLVHQVGLIKKKFVTMHGHMKGGEKSTLRWIYINTTFREVCLFPSRHVELQAYFDFKVQLVLTTARRKKSNSWNSAWEKNSKQRKYPK